MKELPHVRLDAWVVAFSIGSRGEVPRKIKRVIRSSSLHGLGESPVPASSIVVSLSIVFLVYLCLFFRMIDIYMPVVECRYVTFFADVLSIYSCIILFFHLEGKFPTHFLYLRLLSDLI
jgi:hypothetical protein